jgi:hypothetical protein
VNISRRPVIILFFLLIILLIGMIFWPFIKNDIIIPSSIVVWLLLRVFILSIDQKYFWGAICFIVSIIFYRHLLPPYKPIIDSGDFQNSNATIRNIGYWHSLFELVDQNNHNDKTIRFELASLLLALFASKQRKSADFHLYDSIKRGDIPIPERIHTYLFEEETLEKRHSIKDFVQKNRNMVQKWVHHLSGQDAAEQYKMIDEVLSFVETSLEMDNNERKFNPNNKY